MISKKGDMTTKEILEIVLGGAIVLVLLVLLYNLISPNFDVGDETSKAYFDSLEDQIAVADSDSVGSFSIWMLADEDDEREFFLVYFGNTSSFGSGERRFYSLEDNLNHLCICSWEDGDSKCSYCMNLKLPVASDFFDEVGYAPWAVGAGKRQKITKVEGEHYEFVEA